MTEDIAKRLLGMKQKIEEAKIEKAQIQGAIDQNMERLKKEFGVSGLKAAKKKLDALNEEQEALQKKLDKAVDKLEEKYEWD